MNDKTQQNIDLHRTLSPYALCITTTDTCGLKRYKEDKELGL